MAKIINIEKNPFVKEPNAQEIVEESGVFVEELSELREDLISVRNSLYGFDYSVYQEDLMDPAQVLHERSADRLQQEIEDIDDILFDQKWPGGNDTVTIYEYASEAICSGHLLDEIIRNHDSFDGQDNDVIEEIRDVAADVTACVLELIPTLNAIEAKLADAGFENKSKLN